MSRMSRITFFFESSRHSPPPRWHYVSRLAMALLALICFAPQRTQWQCLGAPPVVSPPVVSPPVFAPLAPPTAVPQIAIPLRRMVEGDAAEKRVAASPTVAIDPASENEQLLARLEQTKQDTEKYAGYAVQRSAELQSLRDSEKKLRGLESRAGLSNSIGAMLRRQRSNMPDLRKLRGYRDALQNRIDLQLGASDETDDRRKQVERQLASQVINPDARASLTELQTTLDELHLAQNRLFNQLEELISIDDDLTQVATEFSDYIDQRVLWIRSTDPLWKSEPAKSWEAARWLIEPTNWQGVGQSLLGDAQDRPLVMLLFVLIFAPLVFWQRRMRREVTLLGQTASHSFRIWPTLMTVGWTLLIAAIWPALMAFIGWRLSQASADFARALSAGLIAAAVSFYPMECIRQLCRGGGLAAAHFHWPVYLLRLIRRHLRWLMLLSLPLLLMAAMLISQTEDLAWSSTLGRAGFIAALILATVALWRVLQRDSPLWTFNMSDPDNWWTRFQPIWSLLALLIPLSLAVVAASGYYYTAWKIAWRAQASFWLIVAMHSLRELLARWLLLARRRLVLKQPVAVTSALPEGAPVDAAEREEHPDVVAISEQTSRMLHSLVILSILGGLIAIWADVLPALNFLNRVQLWTDADSKITVSLANVLLAVMIASVTWIAVRNLPGLLEIVVLQRLPLDAAGRYAINAVARYLIVLFGTLSAFSAIGVGWAKVQWLAAAITVGLGFGLQEIFANFMSGLIILFERPMRMGDVITIGGMSGVVSKIRMRATTITDWDRKELIVPNKEFITGRLQNWTLSDQILRVVVQLNLAFEADIGAALGHMLAAANKHPNVMRDPAPQAALCSFNNSVLNFELRVFVPGIGVMGNVQHDLHAAIHDALLAANIPLARTLNDTLLTNVTPAPEEHRNGASSEMPPRTSRS